MNKPEIHPQALPVAGIEWAAVAAGIKKAEPPVADLALLRADPGSELAAVFTRNAFCAAPVQLARDALAAETDDAAPWFCLVNSGNANAGTGEAGLQDARKSCEAVASQFRVPVQRVLPFSTGVIGEPLAVQNICAALPELQAKLDDNGWQAAAEAIMTTDTVAKHASVRVAIDGQPVTISGIAKGAGMIRPNMATMLAYLATDAAIGRAQLNAALRRAVEQSFNRITVDGDTSTNDACVLLATGRSGVSLDPAKPGWSVFSDALDALMRHLAQAIIRDAEGASKFITIEVSGGADDTECAQVAFTIAHSPLVKTAFFASDANWGRILAAIGRSGLRELDVNTIKIWLGDVLICECGGRADAYDESIAMSVMAAGDITVRVELGRGSASQRVWTSDLSHDYVSINADYRT